MGRKKKSEEDESEYISIADARASMRRKDRPRKKSHRIFSDATRDRMRDGQLQRTLLEHEGRVEKFLTKSAEVHGDRYDYSKVEYVNSATKVTIICPDHGEFQKAPAEHARGKGCPTCVAYRQGMDTERYVSQFREVHGDRYDYSKVDYVNKKTKVTIICPDHGEFQKYAMGHRRGEICPTCKRMEVGKKIRKSPDRVIKEFREIHGDRYDYSKVEYRGVSYKITIICPDHGEFRQKAGVHRSGSGCPLCAPAGPRSKASQEGKRLSESSWEQMFHGAHGDRYDYSKVVYEKATNKVTIICPDHGEFEKTPSAHIQGYGCNECAFEERETARQKREREELDAKGRRASEVIPRRKQNFLDKSRAVHGDRYDYSKVVYEHSQTKVTIICPDHGEFLQRPVMHSGGQGCPKCGHKQLGKRPPSKTKSEVVAEFKKVHGNRYDYSKVEYVNSATKVTIICPDHGEFHQLSKNHIAGRGCTDCGRLERIRKIRAKS